MSNTLNSIKIAHFKNTVDATSKTVATPAKVTLPMSQHIGAPCEPVVKIGDLVKIGQIIGDGKGFVCAPIHASVSGKVTAIDDFVMPSGQVTKAVVITSDGLNEIHEDVKPPVVTNQQELVSAIRKSGLVGLGGAGFPTSVKLAIKPEQKVDTLVINAAECEPYITSDNQTLLHDSKDVVEGIEIVKKFLNIPNACIVIESNKPKGTQKIKDAISGKQGITIKSVPSTYPQGAEKVMVMGVTGRVIPEGKLPLDVGVIVMNVTSVAFVAKYLKTGIPLVEKVLTVDGSAIKTPSNLRVPLGTPISQLFEVCGLKCEPAKVLMGGPMMGISVFTTDYPVLKNNNAVLAFDSKEAAPTKPTACICCGRCIAACPFNLMPREIEKAYITGNIDNLQKLKVNICMECGCCSYVCPAKKELVASNKAAKIMLREAKK